MEREGNREHFRKEVGIKGLEDTKGRETGKTLQEGGGD